MSDDDYCNSDGTVIAFDYGEMSASVSVGQNLSPDYIETILRDVRRQVVTGAREVGMAPIANAPIEGGDDQRDVSAS